METVFYLDIWLGMRFLKIGGKTVALKKGNLTIWERKISFMFLQKLCRPSVKYHGGLYINFGNLIEFGKKFSTGNP